MSDNKEQEQQFSIQPHPAKDNDPSSLDGAKGLLGGDKANPTSAAPGPHIMSNETAKSLEEPLSRDELRKRAEELNKD